MATFFLSPIKTMTWHASWAVCHFDGDCLVGAENELGARLLAAERFVKPGAYAEFGMPWLRADLVSAVEMVLGPDNNVSLFNGTVLPLTTPAAVDAQQPVKRSAAC